MVPANIIRDFASEIRQLFHDANFQLKDEGGQYCLPFVFEQALPPPRAGEFPRVPYVVVSLYSGEQSAADEPRTATLHIVGQTFDDTENMQGYVDGLNMIELICQHLYSKTIIAKYYEVTFPCQFAVLDDVRYPYFSAGLAIKVQLHGTAPQNPLKGYRHV